MSLPEPEVWIQDRSAFRPPGLSDDQRQWFEEGFVLKKRFMPAELVDAYWDVAVLPLHGDR